MRRRVSTGYRLLQDAIVRLLRDYPFYGHLALACARREGEGFGLTIAGGVPTIIYNSTYFSAFRFAEQQALIQHVLLHLLHLHPFRRKERHSLVWDLATDLTINPLVANLPDFALLPGQYDLADDLAAEEYYRHLSRYFGVGQHAGQGFGHDEDTDDGRLEQGAKSSQADLQVAAEDRGQLDAHNFWGDCDTMPERLGEEVVRQMVRSAHRKAAGEIPGCIEPLIHSWLLPTAIPWREVLRQFVASAGRVGRKNTWKRENRRFAHATPGQRKRKRLELLIGVDVSDSTMSRAIRERFAGELIRIARAADSRMTVLYSGSRIQQIKSFSSHEACYEIFQGGGFTDLRPVFDHAMTLRPTPAAVIYLTDGYGEAPEKMELPTLWVLTGEGRKPADWGVELRIEV